MISLNRKVNLNLLTVCIRMIDDLIVNFSDDKLPTSKGRLLYLHSSDPTEFWPSLLEKAYAKLYGSYDSYLRFCQISQTMQDLTGGIAQSFVIPLHDGHIMYQIISSAIPKSTLLSVYISENKNKSEYLNHESVTRQTRRNGLITKQSYSITGLTRVRVGSRELPLNEGQTNYYSSFHHLNHVYPHAHHHTNNYNYNTNLHFHYQNLNSCHANHGNQNHILMNHNGINHNHNSSNQQHHHHSNPQQQQNHASILTTTNNIVEVPLIKLRNAWGKGEWNGAWSEQSYEWDLLSDRDKEELTVRCSQGEFWMSFEDFLLQFTNLDIIHIGPDDWMEVK